MGTRINNTAEIDGPPTFTGVIGQVFRGVRQANVSQSSHEYTCNFVFPGRRYYSCTRSSHDRQRRLHKLCGALFWAKWSYYWYSLLLRGLIFNYYISLLYFSYYASANFEITIQIHDCTLTGCLVEYIWRIGRHEHLYIRIGNFITLQLPQWSSRLPIPLQVGTRQLWIV